MYAVYAFMLLIDNYGSNKSDWKKKVAPARVHTLVEGDWSLKGQNLLLHYLTSWANACKSQMTWCTDDMTSFRNAQLWSLLKVIGT